MTATPSPQDRRLRLDLLTFPETSPLVLFGLREVFAAAGVVYPEVTSGQPGEPLFDVRVVAPAAAPFRCHDGVLVEPDLAIADASGADIVVACDMYRPIDSPPHGVFPEAAAWLREMHARGAQVCSVCSGALMLAEAGLLDGREAASHWAYAPMFREHYPQVRLRKGLALCPAGEAGRIVTTGAVTAWQDLALYVIAHHFGPEHAICTAKVYLFSQHSEGQLPYAVTTPRLQDRDALIRDSQVWIAANYAEASPVRRMVARSGLSGRSFTRRFRAATGMAPIAYVQTVRVEEAKQLLETGRLAVDNVAHAVGYEDTASFGRLFRRMTGLSPAAYGRKFASLARMHA
ncbi:helix-turn-helix domain-containing protein [Aquisalimonas sp.]|uniref:GlxA family transcriptional regulator n=1 Tax=Aquisalimonas sp. TaxID=1872621 RepID=UPI0025C0CDCC|nr:helix-turn-helix domain-containing protein [Aquisalimonas sp.]